MGEQLAFALVCDLGFEDDPVAVDLGDDAPLEVVTIPVLHDAGHDEAVTGAPGDVDGQVEPLVLADPPEGQQVVVLGRDERPAGDRQGVVHRAGPGHAGRPQGALEVADRGVGDGLAELVVERVGVGVEGAVHRVQHGRQIEEPAQGDEQEPGVVVDDVEVAVGLDLPDGMRHVADVVGGHRRGQRHHRRLGFGEQRPQLGRRLGVARGEQDDVVTGGGEAVADMLDDPLGAAVAGRRHGDPGWGDLGDLHGGDCI